MSNFVQSFIPLNQKTFLSHQLSSNFLGNNTYMVPINTFLDNFLAGSSTYDPAANAVVNYMNASGLNFGASPAVDTTGVTPFYRLVCTVPDGATWFDSSKCSYSSGSGSYTVGINTYANFKSGNVISSKHNDRSAFIQAVLSEAGIGLEEKTANVTPTTGTAQSVREGRVAVRIGQSKSSVIGVIALSTNNIITPVA
jgi:hypothetical protein